MALFGPLLGVSTVGLVTVLYIFLTRLRRARGLLVQRRKMGLPVAPNHSFYFGHLLFLKSYIDRLPKDAHYQYAFPDIARDHFPNQGAFYMDLWPMSGLYLAIVSPKISTEITQTNPKLHSERPEFLREFFKPISGGLSLFDLDEKDWKPWRAVFNKGFHNDFIYSLVPNMVTEAAVFANTLRGYAARQELCFLDPIALRFAIDMIGRTVLDTSLNSQTGYNALADTMLSQLSWHKFNTGASFLGNLNFVRTFVHWRNGRIMDQYIGAELDKRFDEYKRDTESSASKSIIHLTLKEYIKTTGKDTDKLDPHFRAFAIRQIRLFIFAGYDSTGSSICYCFHLLSQHPDVLKTLRKEHNEVLGPDPAAAASRLSENPHLVNNLHYTLAVVKEVMRLFSPANTTRRGKPGVSVTDDAGNTLPTDDSMIWILHDGIHRNERYWVRPDEFLPERWMVQSGHELYPQPGAWRPFELGPRNCIGQGLVLIEFRVILACLVREFDIESAYDEFDAMSPKKGLKHVRGERAYQIEQGAAHPVDNYPCRVRLAARKWASNVCTVV